MTRQESTKTQTERQQDGFSISLPNSSTRYSTVGAALSNIPDLAASVKERTGWNIDLSPIKVSVVSESEFARRCGVDVIQRTRTAGGEPSQLNASNTGTVPSGVMAAYLPSENSVVLREKAVLGASVDDVKSALFGEMARIAQRQRYPEFFKALDEIARDVALTSKHGADLPRDAREQRRAEREEQLNARLAFAEGHIGILQERYAADSDLHPQSKTGPIEMAMGLSSMLAPSSPERLIQYITAFSIFEKSLGERLDLVNGLFREPAIVDKAFGSNPV